MYFDENGAIKAPKQSKALSIALHDTSGIETKGEYIINIVAVDFDETLSNGKFDRDNVNNCSYEFNQKALTILKEFQARGGKVILWTCRDGIHLDHAVKALQKQAKFTPDCVNSDIEEISNLFGSKKKGKKIYADLYIDDHNSIDKMINWDEIQEWLQKKKPTKADLSQILRTPVHVPIPQSPKLGTMGGMFSTPTLQDSAKELVEESYQDKARRLVTEYYNSKRDISDSKEISIQDTYVVWFSKTLKNWKALVSTTASDNMYYEVTYNGYDQETYIDVYRKFDNIKVTDEVGHVAQVVWVVTWSEISATNPTSPNTNMKKLFGDKRKAEAFCQILSSKGSLYQCEMMFIE